MASPHSDFPVDLHIFFGAGLFQIWIESRMTKRTGLYVPDVSVISKSCRPAPAPLQFQATRPNGEIGPVCTESISSVETFWIFPGFFPVLPSCLLFPLRPTNWRLQLRTCKLWSSHLDLSVNYFPWLCITDMGDGDLVRPRSVSSLEQCATFLPLEDSYFSPPTNLRVICVLLLWY